MHERRAYGLRGSTANALVGARLRRFDRTSLGDAMVRQDADANLVGGRGRVDAHTLPAASEHKAA